MRASTFRHCGASLLTFGLLTGCGSSPSAGQSSAPATAAASSSAKPAASAAASSGAASGAKPAGSASASAKPGASAATGGPAGEVTEDLTFTGELNGRLTKAHRGNAYVCAGGSFVPNNPNTNRQLAIGPIVGGLGGKEIPINIVSISYPGRATTWPTPSASTWQPSMTDRRRVAS
jgi:hypothetical protein